MQFRLRTLLICVCLLAVASMLTVNWLRRPVVGHTLDGESFQLTGHDALIHCVMTNDADSLRRLLLMDSYDLDRTANNGEWTLLQQAIHHRCVGTTTLLLEYGADATLAGNGTPTPMELARRTGNPDLIELLKKFGSNGPHQ